MEPMRYNAFTYIHKALRALLYDTALILQQTDFTNKAESAIAIKKVEQVLEQFESHAYHEDKYVLPALIKFDALLATEIESEHEKDAMLTFRLENKITKLMHAETALIQQMIGEEILHSFIDFVAFNLTHMNKEESLINEVLWKNYSDEELMQITVAIRSAIPPQEMMESFRLMIRGINNPEITAMLSDMKNNAPVEAFKAVEQLAKQELPLSRWQKINESMGEEISL